MIIKRKKTRSFLSTVIVIIFTIAPAFFGSSQLSAQIGLYIKNGLLMKDGKVYYGMGANYYSLFNRTVENRNDLSGIDGLRKLAKKGVPFVRFSAFVYWPNEWKYYKNDKEKYFKNLDAIVDSAAAFGIGLIPSFFWQPASIPDINNEHMEAFADNKSKTIAFLNQYTREIVSRYKNSPAIWAWEFGNEFSLYIDLPNFRGGYVPPVAPEMGTPATRDSIKDRLTQKCMLNAFKNFGAVIRQYDKTRPIFSGNDAPRYAAWHNTHGSTPWQTDTPEQYKKMLLLYEQEPINTITIRGYYAYTLKPNHDFMQYYPMNIMKIGNFLKVIKKWSDEVKKPLFVGEFGIQDYWLREPIAPECWVKVSSLKDAFQERVDAIVDNKIQLSTFWVYDFPAQEPNMNVTFTNSRKYMLDAVIEANKVMKQF